MRNNHVFRYTATLMSSFKQLKIKQNMLKHNSKQNHTNICLFVILPLINLNYICFKDNFSLISFTLDTTKLSCYVNSQSQVFVKCRVASRKLLHLLISYAHTWFDFKRFEYQDVSSSSPAALFYFHPKIFSEKQC